MDRLHRKHLLEWSLCNRSSTLDANKNAGGKLHCIPMGSKPIIDYQLSERLARGTDSASSWRAGNGWEAGRAGGWAGAGQRQARGRRAGGQASEWTNDVKKLEEEGRSLCYHHRMIQKHGPRVMSDFERKRIFWTMDVTCDLLMCKAAFRHANIKKRGKQHGS